MKPTKCPTDGGVAGLLLAILPSLRLRLFQHRGGAAPLPVGIRADPYKPNWSLLLPVVASLAVCAIDNGDGDGGNGGGGEYGSAWELAVVAAMVEGAVTPGPDATRGQKAGATGIPTL